MSPTAKHPVPNKILAQIGDITVSFALLQLMIQLLVTEMVDQGPRIGAIITAELASKNLRVLALSLYRERFGEGTGLSALRKLMKRAAMLEEKRNIIQHSFWATAREKGSVTRGKFIAKEKRGLAFSSAVVSAQDLAEIARQMGELVADLQKTHIALSRLGVVVEVPGEIR